MAIENKANRNRTLNFLKDLDSTINWKPAEELLKKYYAPGRSKDGEEGRSVMGIDFYIIFKYFTHHRENPIKYNKPIKRKAR